MRLTRLTRRRPRRSLAAAVLATAAAAALLTGCSGGGDGGDGDGGGGAAASATPAESGEPGEPTGRETDDGIPDDTVPAEELTPSEGEFTEEQREYLTDRVPVGADPGAILDLGTEACDRLGYLDRHDPEAAAEALAAGEIPDAEAAIEHLCPEYADLLADAGARGESDAEGDE